jgi:hypothetical protein
VVVLDLGDSSNSAMAQPLVKKDDDRDDEGIASSNPCSSPIDNHFFFICYLYFRK